MSRYQLEKRGGGLSNLATHVIYAFSDISHQHKLVPSCATEIQRYQSFNELKIRNPLLKTLLAVGGLNFNTQKFSKMMSTQRKRAKFIHSAIRLLRENGFDGLNLDWRYPGGCGSQPKDKQRFTLLCKELKDAFVAEGTAANRDSLIVTASVSAEKATIDASYEVAQIARYLQCINVWTMDFQGPWENFTRHHSSSYKGSQDKGETIYSNVDYAMRYWRDKGAPTQKLLMGFAAYGRSFNLSTASSDVGAPANGPGEERCFTGEEGLWAYYETCSYFERVTIKVIADQKVPYATIENQWIGFDNKDSLDFKVSYLKTNNFGGAFVWSLDLDDFGGQFCKQGNYPFISHLHNLLVPGNQNEKSMVFKQHCKCCEHPTTAPTTTIRTTPSPTTSPTTTTSQTNLPTRTTTIYLTTTTTSPTIATAPTTTTKTATTTSTTTPTATAAQTTTSSSTTSTTSPTITTAPTTNTATTTSTTTPTATAAQTTTASLTTTTPPPTKTKTSITTPTTNPKLNTTSERNHGNFCNGKSRGLFPNPTDQYSFYNCTGQIGTIESCPSNMVFNKQCECCEQDSHNQGITH
ncbi:chitotriosidase-1-like [Anoplopoma fimbria]|uniref:chitotriosidase-1-like n=1 Tax=Anoplopoma fimbria TaxID=229290 RepID=UPI0023EB19AC|nr:chitotriosidase-1-like [Anoplopoma fimbria]